jgi:hypothetical protein
MSGLHSFRLDGRVAVVTAPAARPVVGRAARSRGRAYLTIVIVRSIPSAVCSRPSCVDMKHAST